VRLLPQPPVLEFQSPSEDYILQDLKLDVYPKSGPRKSKDRSKVGAVVVTKEAGAIALGYNGFPSGIEDDERLDNRKLKLNMIIHAEQNALLIAGYRSKGATLYVWGKAICSRCAVVIIQAGIERVFTQDPRFEKRKEWRDSGLIAEQMFNEVEIKPVYYAQETYLGGTP
jgi:dCMP deaminase